MPPLSGAGKSGLLADNLLLLERDATQDWDDFREDLDDLFEGFLLIIEISPGIT